MKKMWLAMGWLLLGGLAACAAARGAGAGAPVRAEVISLGTLDCFEAGLTDTDGKPVFCEGSAVVLVDDRLVIANDKYIPGEGNSNVFSVPLSEIRTPESLGAGRLPYGGNFFNQPSKIESLTATPGGELYFGATAFDRIQSDSKAWDSYNMLFYWEKDHSDRPRLLFQTEDEGIVSSKSLRSAFEKVLRTRNYPNGVGYFKIEGLVALPDNSLLFGIREIGSDYTRAEQTFLLVRANYLKSSAGVIVDPVLELVYAYDPRELSEINKPLGVAALEYHAPSEQILISTTYEQEGQPFESYFWSLSLEQLRKRLPPVLVRDKQGNPLTLPHKAEGLTFLNKKTAFVICDEDKNLSPVATGKGQQIRQPHQAVYAVLRFDW